MRNVFLVVAYNGDAYEYERARICATTTDYDQALKFKEQAECRLFALEATRGFIEIETHELDRFKPFDFEDR